MHTNIKNNVLCLTTSELNNSLSEVKDYLDFNITFSQDFKKDIESSKYSGIIIDADILDQDLTTLLNSIENKIKVLISNAENKHNFLSNKIIDRPFSIVNLNKIILNLITGDKFNKNLNLNPNHTPSSCLCYCTGTQHRVTSFYTYCDDTQITRP